jgi:hypothetical protein
VLTFGAVRFKKAPRNEIELSFHNKAGYVPYAEGLG